MAQNKHLSYNEIPDFQTDWTADPTNENKPFSGRSVQRFVKRELQKGYGYSRTNSGNMQFFRSAEDADLYDQGDTSKLLNQTPLSGTNVEFRFVNQYQGNVYINGDNAFMLPVTVRSVDINTDQSETPHDANVSLAIQVNLNNGTTVTDLGQFPANTPFEINVTPYVADGATFVLVASDDDGYRRTSSRYSVTRANLSLQFQNNSWWASAYRQGDTLWNVPLSIDVNVPAKLVATISKDGVTYVAKEVLSSEFSANYALTLGHPLSFGGSGGVYELRLELSTTDESLAGLAPVTLGANIFCVAADSTDLLLAVNNVATELQNYSNNRVFDYAVFAGQGNHTFTIEADEDGTAIAAPQTIQAQNGIVGTYYLNMEMERQDDTDFTVTLKACFDDDTDSAFSADITATNRLGYSATAGASLLVKDTGRSNSEANREKLVDILTGAQISPVWTGMTWSSVDGHQSRTMQDSQNQTVDVAFIRLLSGQSMQLPVTPLKMSAAQGRTLEIMFQPRNVIDYDTPVIQCLDNDQEGSGYNGLKVTPNRVTLLTAGSRNEDVQSKNFDTEDVIHLTIVVNPSYREAGSAFNACFIYINGVKQRVFAYNRDLNVASQLLFGSANADIDIYAIRTYNTALSSDEVVTNAVNWKFSLADKALMKAHNNVKENGKVDFNKVRSLCNVFVFKAGDGSGNVPTLGWGKKDEIKGTLKTYWRDNPEWDTQIQCALAGQGTSSMEYFRWNFKTTFPSSVNYDGGQHPGIKKWCAKKNYASSMQSHKMGGTETYDYLARATGAVPADAPRQAIWQYPFVGFAEDGNGNMTFIGLYTVGPDKGDKDTFGFGSGSVALEGLDNDRLSTNFRCPWNDNTVVADAENEKYTVCGEQAWEDSRKNAEGVSSRWKPAYNLVYECSQLIRPWKGLTYGGTAYPATLQGLLDYGESIATIDTSTDEGKALYQASVMYEYWISGSYDLYRFDHETGQYVQSYTDHAVNLQEDLCGKGYVVGQQQSGGQTTDILLTTAVLGSASDDDARNELLLAARLSKFKKEIGGHFDVTDAFFHLAWVEFNAATDNLAKNTYPYIMDYTDPDARWKWREDDVDTVWPIENQGKDKKPYCVELEDNYSDYGLASLWVWNGRFSQFWYTLKAAFSEEYEAWVRTTFFQALHYGSATNLLQRVMDFFQHFYFDRAQEYFGATLYNADSIFCYEQAYLYGGTYAHKGIALEQALGDHYSAEKYWIRMRTIYMMSKYKADLFAAGQTTDCFATRVGEGVNSYTLTPAIYMYPVVQNGEQAIRGPRFWPGNAALTQWTAGPITTAGDQTFRINGMSYLRSVGDLYRNTLKESVSVAGQMLRQLNLGSHNAEPGEIKSTVNAVSIGNATSLRVLDLAQLPALAGTVNLAACPNLREVYAGGTALAAVLLSDGGPLQTLVLGDNITTLQLRGKQMLSSLVIGSTGRLANVEMQNCNGYTVSSVMAILGSIATSQLQSVQLAFGTASDPSVLTDTDILTLLAIHAADIETKRFSGYITKAEGRVNGSTWAALNAMNITYIGDIAPDVHITSDDITIEQDAATVYSGDTVVFRAIVQPPTAGTPRFRLYNGSTPVQEDEHGVATFGGASLDCATGTLVTTEVQESFAVKVSAIADGDTESEKITVTITKTVTMDGFTLTGTKTFAQTGNSTLAITPTNSDYTVRIASLEAALSYGGQEAPADEYLRVTGAVPGESPSGGTVSLAVLGIPAATRQYSLRVTVTDTKGNVYTRTETVSVQSIPVTSFELSGSDELTAAGEYPYSIADILPANANRGIASIAVSVSAPASGSVSAAADGTSGVALTVSQMPAATETVVLTVIATLAGGGNVTATKQVQLKVLPLFVDMGLPSGTLWAKGNIVKDAQGNYGIGEETDNGCYFSWGNTEGHNSTDGTSIDDGYRFSADNYSASTGAALTADIASNDAEHDAALATLGSPWRMPTKENIDELLNTAYIQYIDGDGNPKDLGSDNRTTTVNGVTGIRLRSKANGNILFIPTTGIAANVVTQRTLGGYWSSSYWDNSYAYILRITIVTPPGSVSSYQRYFGFAIRPVQ